MDIVLAAVTAFASAAFHCPATIEDVQSVGRPAGSESVKIHQSPRALDGMRAFVGHPSERVQIQPDGWSKKGTHTWDFGRNEDIWIECTYRDSAAIVTYHVGATRQCSYVASGSGLTPNVGSCASAAP
jgi:hypothetical protein